MNKKKILKKNFYIGYFALSIVAALVFLFVGGLSHQFPQLSFVQVFQPEILKQYVIALLPIIK
jgi:hypothetical protein